MARFFFDTDDGGLALQDDCGLELDCAASALTEARRAIAALAADVEAHTEATLRPREVFLTVRSELGVAILALTLSLVVQRFGP